MNHLTLKKNKGLKIKFFSAALYWSDKYVAIRAKKTRNINAALMSEDESISNNI